MLLEIQESRTNDIAVLQLTGKLALGRESQRIENLVDDFGRRQERKVIFDMTGVHYIDSAGIGILALAAGKLREGGGKLVVVAPPDGRVAQLLTMTQVSSIVALCPTMDEAMAGFA